ncbi:MAG: hypothetical protein L7S67_05175 [Flavobacteriales bacterium]|nr:hypothetical protein [Flavobacteriales bacterium]
MFRTISRAIALSIIVLCAPSAWAQSATLEVTVEGLFAGANATLTLERGVGGLHDAALTGSGETQPVGHTFQVDAGPWLLSIDAPGYFTPAAQTVEVSGNAMVTLDVALLQGDSTSYTFNWEEDGSYAGHATEFVPAAPPVIEVLGEAHEVPAGFSAQTLFQQFGFVLDDHELSWTTDDAFKLHETVSSLPYPRVNADENGTPVTAVWRLTEDMLDGDYMVETIAGTEVITVAKDAFTYAAPLVVNFDGDQGQFFSRRLFKALLSHLTDEGTQSNLVQSIATDRYGVEFMVPSPELEDLMSETQTNFQPFPAWEKLQIMGLLEEFPVGMRKQDGLSKLVRRINGQPNPFYPTAPAIAWTGMETIEWMESGFANFSIDYIHRLVLHEKAHFLWEYTFDDDLRSDWTGLGGWFEDPNAPSGWSSTLTTEFVSAYAHAMNPNEDMAESIAYYISNPLVLSTHAPDKYDFIRDRVMHGSRYVALIAEELTFEVFNLFPDYTYPGKIVGTQVQVVGNPEDDKELTLTVHLHSDDPNVDGAASGQVRFVSAVGTIFDMWLAPQNGSSDSILTGTLTLNKHMKSGWWNFDGLHLWDAVGNDRYESPATIGLRMFLNNPLEDITPPEYMDGSFVMEEAAQIEVGNGADGPGTVPGITVSYDTWDKIPLSRGLTRVSFPTTDPDYGHRYSMDIQSNQFESNGYEEVKHHEMELPVPHYFPTGHYTVNFAGADDVAGNSSLIYFTGDPNYSNADGVHVFAEDRDSVFMETTYPDLLPPVVDLNSFVIDAAPTNPEAPNGETLVTFTLTVQDTSGFDDFASGIKNLTYTLRNPVGEEFHQDAWEEFGGANFYYAVYPPEGANEWTEVTLTTLLPAGSIPGTWGVSAISVRDRALNVKRYSFVEYVQFVLDESPCPADLDGNGQIGAPDLLMVLAEFGCLQNCGIADIDGNDQVDVGDALLFLADYGTACD